MSEGMRWDPYAGGGQGGWVQVPPPPRPGRGAGPVVAVVGLLVVVALVAGGVYLVRSRGGDPVATPTPSPTAATASGPTTEPTTEPTAGATTGATTGTATGATTGTVTATPAETAGPGTVSLAPDLAGNPAAQQIAATFTRYFTALNEQRLEDAYTIYTGAQKARMGTYEQWRRGFPSTTDDQIVLTALDDAGSGLLVAHLRFRSTQAPADAPDKTSGCLLWRLAYTMRPSAAGGWLVDAVRPDVPGSTTAYTPCP